MTSDAIKPAFPVLMSLMDPTRESETYHITSPPSLELKGVLSGPVLEICRFKNVLSTFEKKVIEFREEGKKLDVQRGVVNGWVVEKGEGEGGEMVALVAWESVEKHREAMESDMMREASGKAKEHMGDVSLHHVVLTKFVK